MIQKHQNGKFCSVFGIGAAFGGRKNLGILNCEIMISKGKSIETRIFSGRAAGALKFRYFKLDYFGLRNRLLFYSQINGNSDKWEFEENLLLKKTQNGIPFICEHTVKRSGGCFL